MTNYPRLMRLNNYPGNRLVTSAVLYQKLESCPDQVLKPKKGLSSKYLIRPANVSDECCIKSRDADPSNKN